MALSDLHRVKRAIIEVGRRMYARGMVAANDGNISQKLGGGLFALTTAGVSKGFLSPDDIVVVDESGRKIEGGGKPTSEAKLHLFAYSKRPDVGAVCHAHPPFATAFAVSGRALPPDILPEIILALSNREDKGFKPLASPPGGGIPLTPYATPSTEELARSIEEHLAGADAFLLANHGVLTLGADLTQAYHRLETVEHYAKIAWLALSLGGATPLPEGELDRLWCISRGLAPDCREGGSESHME